MAKKNDTAPALLLMIFAPLLTEILPGATRFSSLFVFPIEICVWGGGAVLIRYVVRKRQLDWVGMLLLALALAIAEEFLIQQSSVAPMVIRLKGITYARAWDINYVYLLWALIYESVFVVMLPVSLVELLFPARRERAWMNKAGVVTVSLFFAVGCGLAWYTWTQIARPKFFKVPAYTPALSHILIAVGLIVMLVATAWGRIGKPLKSTVGKSVPVFLIFIAGAVWSSLLFGLVLLGFGIAPGFPPLLAVTGGGLLIIVALWQVPMWAAATSWQRAQRFALGCGVITGSMLISFLGFVGTTGPDLYFKIITNVIAAALLTLFALRLRKEKTAVL